LSGDFDRDAYAFLLNTNRIRAAAWSAYGILDLWMTWQAARAVAFASIGSVLHTTIDASKRSEKEEEAVEKASGPNIPRTLEEVCDPRRMALLVYDMQVGIVSQLRDGPEITARVAEVLRAAREGGFPVFFSRHMSLPKELMGVFQIRQAMAWQRVERLEDVEPWFPRDSPQFQVVPDLEPLPSEAVSDKIAMSAFSGTFLNMAFRDLGIDAFAICGIATELGIEPTVRHGADLGFVPVVVKDACGAWQRSGGAALARAPGPRRRRPVHRNGDHQRPSPRSCGAEERTGSTNPGGTGL
jgi:nicotinamidase-related amidase